MFVMRRFLARDERQSPAVFFRERVSNRAGAFTASARLRFAQAVRFGYASRHAAGRATRASLQVDPVVRKPAFAQFVQNESGLHGGYAALREILFVSRDDIVGAYLLGAA